PAEGDLVFVSGNPGSTARLWPIARLAHERDSYTPGVIELLRTRESALSAFASLGDAERIQVLDELFGVRNSMKAFQGHLGGLLDDSIWQRKVDEEEAFRKAAAGDADVEAAFQVYERTRVARDAAFPNLIFARLDGDLGNLALQVVRLGRALEMPEDQRPPAYRGEALKSLIARLSSGQAIDPRLAEHRLRANYESAQKVLRNDHPYVKAALQTGKSAAESAKAAIAQTVLLRPAGLKALLESGGSAIQSSTDPILTVARIADPLRTEASGRWQAAEAEEAEAGAVLAQARFRIYGSSLYPDATFTLRLSMGVCKGYELGTTLVPWTTTFYGLYARNAEMGNKEPFDLPERWKKAERSLDLSTPYNFVSTNDIIGGNSGSPVISKNLELVGLIFDGNIQSLPNRYLYLDEVCRSVSVHSKGMTHALERVYKAYRVLDELGL
ncbi:MAG TPA: S46 family peptidase, partial [Planctomycetota bacterium]|nr:S46 family peptidase [Planctomycetota bacterium]